MPAAQKIIMSKYDLRACSREVVAEHLRMSTDEISLESEAVAIHEFCCKLYQDEAYSMYFDEADKAALIKRRVDQLSINYIKKNSCCVGIVTEDEDKAVYELIKRCKESLAEV